MERRGFLQALAAGAAVIMLPSLAVEATPVIGVPAAPATAAELTAWIQSRFRVFDMLPAAFMEVKVIDMPRLYGLSIHDLPNGDYAYDHVTDEAASVRFTHRVMAFGVEGDDPVEAERRLTQAM